MITKIIVAKEATSLVTSAVIANAIQTAVTRATGRDEQDTTVRLVSAFGGWIASAQLRPATDHLVDVAAAKLSTIRENRRNKKQA